MMKKLLKTGFVISLLILNIFNLYSQELTIQETIDYINEKINSNRAFTGDENARYFWELSEDGKLTITRYWNEEWESSQIVYIKGLDADKMQVATDFQSVYSYSIQIPCKKNEKNVTKKWNNSVVKSPVIYIRFSPDKEVARRLKNAIIYLIKLAEKEEKYKVKEKDPFDY